MASYSPDYTARYRALYVAAGIQHHMQFRFARGTSDADIQSGGAAACNTVASYLATLLPDDFEFLGAEYASEDSEIFVPGTVPGTPTCSIALADLSAVERITSTTFAAKGTAGRTRVSIYCPDYDEDTLGDVGSRGVINSGELTAIGNVVTHLNSLAIHPVTNGNTLAVWYPRATIKRNDDLLKKVRRGLLA